MAGVTHARCKKILLQRLTLEAKQDSVSWCTSRLGRAASRLGSEGGKLDELGLWEHLAVLDEGSPIEDGKRLIKFWTSLEW